jgi:hypothetical protein
MIFRINKLKDFLGIGVWGLGIGDKIARSIRKNKVI